MIDRNIRKMAKDAAKKSVKKAIKTAKKNSFNDFITCHPQLRIA